MTIISAAPTGSAKASAAWPAARQQQQQQHSKGKGAVTMIVNLLCLWYQFPGQGDIELYRVTVRIEHALLLRTAVVAEAAAAAPCWQYNVTMHLLV